MRKIIFWLITILIAISAPLTGNCATIKYTAGSLRDPFEPPSRFQKMIRRVEPGRERPRATGLRIQGIFFKGPKPKAIINDKIVGIGETIEGAKVIDITREGVKVLIDSEEITLTIIEER
jgi:hypothetical protein